MNDFTKEELEHILECCEELRNDCGHDDYLIEKIQSMIDNYCEHKNQGSISDADYVYFCQDCNVITGI